MTENQDPRAIRQEFIKSTLYSLTTLADAINHKIPQIKQQQDIRNNEFPIQAWNKLNDFHKEINIDLNTCKSELDGLVKKNQTIVDLNKCAEEVLNVVTEQCNKFNTTLGSRGFVSLVKQPVKKENTPSTEKETVLQEITNENVEQRVPEVKPLASTLIRSDAIKETECDITESPISPKFNRKKQESLIDTPPSPKFETDVPTNNEKKGNFFTSLTTPSVKPTKEKPSALPSYFAPLTTPETPKFSLEYKSKTPNDINLSNRLKSLESKIRTPDNEILRLHTRRSWLMGQNDPEVNSPDATLYNLDVGAKTGASSRHLDTPESPCLQLSYDHNKKSYFKEGGEVSVAGNRRRSYWIEEEDFNELEDSIKNLLTLEQANSALDSIRMHAKELSTYHLTFEDIKDATSLAEKTKCCILMLTVLQLISKVPGRKNLYKIV